MRWSWARLNAATSCGVHPNSFNPFVWCWAVALSKGSMRVAKLGRAGSRVLYRPRHELTDLTVFSELRSVSPRSVRM